MSRALNIEICHPSELGEDVLNQWQSICASHPTYQTPLLSPEFAQMIGRIRPDARTILARNDDQLVACLGIHMRPVGFARPIGAPFADVSGPVFAPGYQLSIEDLVNMAGIHSYRADHTILQPGLPIPESQDLKTSYIIAPGERSAEEYLEERRAAHPKRFKNMRRLRRKFESDIGPLTFHWGRPNKVHLEQLLKWKSDQFLADGFLDLSNTTHSKDILTAAAQTTGETVTDFGGFMTWLCAGDQLAAGHFGVRKGAYFHPWISAYNPDFQLYMPGVQLLRRAVEASSDMGLGAYDLAGGHGHYKKYFAEDGRETYPLHYCDKSAFGLYQKTKYAAWNLLGARNDTGVAARMRRRLDHIACCEHAILPRVREFGYAVAKRRN